MGEELARQAPVSADMVMPVPESGIPAAQGYARASGIPYGDGLVKNRYVGRTFIQPNQKKREQGVRLKLNPLAENIRGKRLVVVEDSIVRGTTLRQLVSMLREAGRGGGALPRVVAALQVALLLRSRHRSPFGAACRRHVGRRDPRPHRRRLARLPRPRPPDRGHRARRRARSAPPACRASTRSRFPSSESADADSKLVLELEPSSTPVTR